MIIKLLNKLVETITKMAIASVDEKTIKYDYFSGKNATK